MARGASRRDPRTRRRLRRRPPPRADVPDNLIRGAVLGAIIVAAIWILFGTGPS